MASLHRFQSQLLHAVGQAVIATDLDGYVSFWNRAAERLYGWSAGEAVGRRIDRLLVSEELAERAADIMARVLAGETWAGEFTIRGKDGRSFPVHVTDAPLVDDAGRIVGIVGVSLDLTEERGAADALRTSQRRVAWLADATPDIFWEWEVSTDRVWRSSDLGARIGKPALDAREAWRAGVHPDDRVRVQESLRRATREGAASWSAEYRFARGDGTYADVLDRARIVRDASGAVERVLGVMMDITERKAAERELETTRRALAQAEKLSALGMLVSGIAHELKTPLAYIATNVHLARSRLEGAAQRGEPAAAALERSVAHFDEAAQGIDRINRLVLELRRFNRGRAHAHRKATLDGAAVAAVDLFRLTVKGRAQVAASIHPTPNVLVDDEQMQQVVLNLLDNAADAAPGTTIHLDVAPTPTGALLRVRDEGAGIPEGLRGRIFDAFFTTKPQGTGLGLAIVHRIVRDHKGSISFASAPGKGTTFEIALPSGDPE